jgi:CRISPR-associated protein Cmr1
MDRIHETGIIGNLRGWYEAIIRGLGGKACDPSQPTCKFNVDKYHQAVDKPEWERLREAGLCDVCQVFGTTGWKRWFQLEIEDRSQLAWNPPPDALNIRPPDRNRGWYLPPGRMGELSLHFRGEEQALKTLATLFLFLEQWGSLGAKSQLGYGVFEILNRDEVQRQIQGWEWKVMESGEINAAGANGRSSLPDLRQFGFFGYRFKPESPGWWTRVPGMERLLGSKNMALALQQVVKQYYTVPLAPSLKNEWRFHRWNGPGEDEEWMFGTLKWQGDNKIQRVRSKVAVSWAYSSRGAWPCTPTAIL